MEKLKSIILMIPIAPFILVGLFCFVVIHIYLEIIDKPLWE